MWPSGAPKAVRVDPEGTGPGWGVRLGVGLIRAYQSVGSPFFGGACRFVPSCSSYAVTAIEQHGVRRGGWLAIRRLARCRPLGSFGFDPVPPVPAGRPRLEPR